MSNKNNYESKKYLVLLHGFKKNNEKVFDVFLEEFNKLNDSNDFEIIEFEYYDNLDKETLKASKFIKSINQKLDSLDKNREIYIIGYSMGGVASLSFLGLRKNITKIIALSPVFKIDFFNWPIKLIKNLQKNSKIKKKLGKKRYKSLKSKRNMSEKYPIRITNQINIFRLKIRKKVKKIKNKDIYILFSKNDSINKLEKTIKYLGNNFNFEDNDLKIDFLNTSHFEMIDKQHIETIKKIFNFLQLK